VVVRSFGGWNRDQSFSLNDCFFKYLLASLVSLWG
jgi:hypothetical protein